MLSAWKYSSCLTGYEYDVQTFYCQLSVGMGNLFFSLADMCGRYSCMMLWWMLEHPILCGNLFFPICSIWISFSFALVRLCKKTYPLLHVFHICNASLVEAMTEDFDVFFYAHFWNFLSDTVKLLLLLEYVFVLTWGSVSKLFLHRYGVMLLEEMAVFCIPLVDEKIGLNLV